MEKRIVNISRHFLVKINAIVTRETWEWIAERKSWKFNSFSKAERIYWHLRTVQYKSASKMLAMPILWNNRFNTPFHCSNFAVLIPGCTVALYSKLWQGRYLFDYKISIQNTCTIIKYNYNNVYNKLKRNVSVNFNILESGSAPQQVYFEKDYLNSRNRWWRFLHFVA